MVTWLFFLILRKWDWIGCGYPREPAFDSFDSVPLIGGQIGVGMKKSAEQD
jgi:hypothetical protein